MELIWIFLITSAAALFAYFIGGYIDRRAMERLQEEEQIQKQETLRGIVHFARAYATVLGDRSLIDRRDETEACRLLCHQILEEEKRDLSDLEWGELLQELERGERGAV